MKMGSLFSGIGGLDLGLERSIPGLQTVWQVEKEEFCRSILERHWPNTKRYNNVLHVGAHNLEPVDVICAGFPCQSVSIAGKMRGLEDEEKSGLWWHVHRLVSEFQSIGHEPILVLENVANIIRVGGPDVVGSLTAIGYDIEWTIISAAQCGAPHLRRRWFAVAYPSTIGYYMRNAMAFGELVDGRWTTTNASTGQPRQNVTIQARRSSTDAHDTAGSTACGS
jgi:DNA (cytosine-5)-methyltransferase 1